MTHFLDDDEKLNRQIGGFGNRGVITISESGLYNAIMRSTKPEARPFRKWVTSEVLPSIRKTGQYKSTINIKEYLRQGYSPNDIHLLTNPHCNVPNSAENIFFLERCKPSHEHHCDTRKLHADLVRWYQITFKKSTGCPSHSQLVALLKRKGYSVFMYAMQGIYNERAVCEPDFPENFYEKIEKEKKTKGTCSDKCFDFWKSNFKYKPHHNIRKHYSLFTEYCRGHGEKADNTYDFIERAIPTFENHILAISRNKQLLLENFTTPPCGYLQPQSTR